MEGSSRIRARGGGCEGELGAAYTEAGCPVPIGNRLAAEPMGLIQDGIDGSRSVCDSSRVLNSRSVGLLGEVPARLVDQANDTFHLGVLDLFGPVGGSAGAEGATHFLA